MIALLLLLIVLLLIVTVAAHLGLLGFLLALLVLCFFVWYLSGGRVP